MYFLFFIHRKSISIKPATQTHQLQLVVDIYLYHEIEIQFHGCTLYTVMTAASTYGATTIVVVPTIHPKAYVKMDGTTPSPTTTPLNF